MSRFIAIYKGTAIILLNALLLFVVLNVGLGLFLAFRQPFYYGRDLQRSAYPGWSDKDCEQLMRETRWHAMAYRPLVGYKSREFHGKFVNITPYGARRGRENLSWPPSSQTVNVFVFGGSTTFGLGVADSETIPSYIQEALQKLSDRPVAVYNFGTESYSSSEEAALFLDLMRTVRAPDVAIFIDGVNEPFNIEGYFDLQMRSIVEAVQLKNPIPALLLAAGRLPLMRALDYLRPRVFPQKPIAHSDQSAERWRNNKKLIEAIARSGPTKTLFVWQPTASYNYDIRYHYLYHSSYRRDLQSEFHQRLKSEYTEVASRREDLEKSGDFLWLADIQQDRRTNLYVDTLHYNPELCRLIGEQVAARTASMIQAH